MCSLPIAFRVQLIKHGTRQVMVRYRILNYEHKTIGFPANICATRLIQLVILL